MSGLFLHFPLAGDRRALLRPSQIGGMLTCGPDLQEIASKERPLRVMVVGGETMDAIGISAGGLIDSMGSGEDEFEHIKRAGKRYLVWDVS
ncbi:MAG: hypothetical protein KGL39_25160 [Patescibacteria group bacterium]|nr:hypothetical protein [Patescibacteria group bacterium]